MRSGRGWERIGSNPVVRVPVVHRCVRPEHEGVRGKHGRVRGIPIAGAIIWVAPIEYVILRKLEYYRMAASDRHLVDIAAMRRISGATIDHRALGEWIERLGLEREWGMTDPGGDAEA